MEIYQSVEVSFGSNHESVLGMVCMSMWIRRRFWTSVHVEFLCYPQLNRYPRDRCYPSPSEMGNKMHLKGGGISSSVKLSR